jgi:hypothetical protein
MKNFNRLLGLIFVGLASTAMFVACADETAQSCLLDTDCDPGLVCESDICVQTCATVADCPVGDRCVARPSGGAENVCEVDPDFNNSTNNNSTNTNNTNNTTTPSVYVVLITDVSSGDSCTGDDPGSDIVFAALETLEGTVLGYGSLDYDGITGGDANTFSAGLNLDGSAPSFTGTCPEFDETSVTALGCGGEIGVRFYDDNNTPIPIVAGTMQVRVFEFGSQCSTGSTSDEFEISVCTDTDAVVNDGNTTSCGASRGGGSGEAVIEI